MFYFEDTMAICFSQFKSYDSCGVDTLHLTHRFTFLKFTEHVNIAYILW